MICSFATKKLELFTPLKFDSYLYICQTYFHLIEVYLNFKAALRKENIYAGSFIIKLLQIFISI